MVLPTVIRERNTFHVLHDEEWRSVGRSVRIVQPRDGRMVQLRQRALLGGEARASRGGKPGVAQNLDGHLAAQVFAFRQIHHAHSAFAQQFYDSIRTKFLEWLGVCGRIVEDIVRDEGDIAVEQGTAAGIFLQQHQDFVE